MKVVYFIIIFFWHFTYNFSQDTIRLYLDKKFHNSTKENALLVRSTVVINNHYHILDQYLDGKLVNYGEYSSLTPKFIEDGLSIYYDLNGDLYAYGYYKNGELTGKWTYVDNSKLDTVTFKYKTETVDYAFAANYKDSLSKDNYLGSIKIAPDLKDDIQSFIRKNIYNPARMRTFDSKYRLKVSALLDVDGTIKFPKISNCKNDDFKKEALRVLFLYKTSSKITKAQHFETSISFQNKETDHNMKELIFIIAEEPATFQGGDITRFNDYIQHLIIYPKVLQEQKTHGLIVAQFIVNRNGDIVNPKIITNISDLLNSLITMAYKIE